MKDFTISVESFFIYKIFILEFWLVIKMNFKKLLPILAGIGTSLIFGFSFLFTKETLEIMNPIELLAHRFLLATLFLGLLILLQVIKIKFSWQMCRDLLLVSFFQPLCYFIFETYGVQLTSATESGLLTALIPVAVAILSSIFLKEKVSWKQWFYIMFSVFGMMMIITAKGRVIIGNHLFGIGSLLLAVVSAAIFNILSRKLSKKYNPIEITAMMMFSGALFFNFCYFVTTKDLSLDKYCQVFLLTEGMLGLGYLGILSSVVAFFLVNYTLEQMPAVKSVAFVNLTTVISVVAGILFGKENFNWWQFSGALLIIIGVWGTNVTGLNNET